jgi:HEAT repeat protein
MIGIIRAVIISETFGIKKRKRDLMQCLLLLSALLSAYTVSEGVRRIHSHLLLDDVGSAVEEAQRVINQYPESEEALSAQIESLAAAGKEEEALQAWEHLFQKKSDLLENRHLLEELSWGVLKKGLDSTQHGVRFASLIGSYLTRDVRAVPILLKMMRGSNAVIRSVAVQMSASYQDACLKDEIIRMMSEEKVWMVRLEVIKAAGALKIKELSKKLQQEVQSERSTFEERHLAIEALLNMYDQVSLSELQILARSDRAGLRHFACSIAAHFEMKEAKEDVLNLLNDPHPDVKIAALNALGLFYRTQMTEKEVKEKIAPHLQSSNATVAITAGWVALLVDPSLAAPHLNHWLTDSLAENRRLAAAALSKTGKKGVALSIKTLRENPDPYVKANLALGLLGQRVEIAASSDALYTFLENEKRMWMWDTLPNPLFQVLAPNQVRHVDHIPNYPKAIDQMTRLNLVSLLAIVEDPRAIQALKTFLQKSSWGITGVAAATLLQEGGDSALEIVRELLSDADSNVRLQAALVLAMLGRDESVLADLQTAYGSADHEQKLHILEALGRVGNESSSRFLITVFKEPFPILRVAAAAAMIQSLNR